MRRLWIEATIVGISIGLMVVVLQYGLQGASTPIRVLVFVLAGLALCVVQLGVSRWRR